MQKIGLVTDEAADLLTELVEKYQIEVVPAKLDWTELDKMPGENTFRWN